MEPALLRAIREAPGDLMTWSVLGDWLEDQGDPRADLVRLRVELAGPPQGERAHLRLVRRQAEILAAGVRPAVPAFVNEAGMEMVLIPAGSFLMGSPEDEEGRYEDEGPRHQVTITRPYWLGRGQVTQGQFRRVMGSNPSHFSASGGGAEEVAGLDADALPVDRVTWNEAARFCQRLSSLHPGPAYRLPTEAEWEHACRAGSRVAFSCGAKLTSGLANFDGTRPYGSRERGKYLKRTSPMGSYPPNAWGLFDMHGNVWEWCADWFDREYYAASPSADPEGPASGAEKVLRGGSYYYIGSSCRAAIRLDREPEARSNLDGFRVALPWRG